MRGILKWVLIAGCLPVMAYEARTVAAQEKPANGNSRAFKEEFIPVEKDVKLQVLDWGGTGRPLVLLAGLTDEAHEWDSFVPKLVPRYHVYAITRRGFGSSSAPQPTRENYKAERLGNDVLAVMEALKINQPVLVGHSFGGEEMTSIGTRHPEKIAGLIYLDAAYIYAYYNDHAAEGHRMFTFDTIALRNELDAYDMLEAPREEQARLEHLLKVSLPRYQKELEGMVKWVGDKPDNAPGSFGPPNSPQARIVAAIFQGGEIFGGVHCPVLAIYADPHLFSDLPTDPAKREAALAADKADVSEQADAFQAANPSATVIRIPNADHYVFRSNEAEVLRAIDAFVAGLQH